jgi:hypothetical protein
MSAKRHLIARFFVETLRTAPPRGVLPDGDWVYRRFEVAA